MLYIAFVFNLLIGVKAAILRASIFFAINTLSKNFRKYNLPVNIFFMTIIVMLLIYPDFLTDAGFILSFSATAGILIITPLIEKILSLFRGTRTFSSNYFVKIFIINTSVSLMILPLSHYYFGGYYLLSFLTNIICIPVFYFILLLLFGGSVAALFMPFCGDIFLKTAIWPSSILIAISDFFSGFSTGYLEAAFFKKPSNIFLYYLLLTIAIFFLNYYLSRKCKTKLKNVV